MPHRCRLKNSWSEGAAKGTIQQISPSNGNQAPPICAVWYLYVFRCISSWRIWITSVCEILSDEEALRSDKLGNSETILSSWILAASLFALGFLCLGTIGATKPVFFKY